MSKMTIRPKDVIIKDFYDALMGIVKSDVDPAPSASERSQLHETIASLECQAISMGIESLYTEALIHLEADSDANS